MFQNSKIQISMRQIAKTSTMVAGVVSAWVGCSSAVAAEGMKSPFSQSSLEILSIVASPDLAKILGPKRSIDAILRVPSGYTVISEECTVSVLVEGSEKPTPPGEGLKLIYGPLACGD